MGATDMKDNIFKDLPKVYEGQHCYAVRDGFPVTKGHTLIVPYREGATVENLRDEELVEIFQIIRFEFNKSGAEGFNIGVNQGEVAGQTVGQLHFHMIPRRTGDVENPRGGVRHTIPGKGDY